MSGYGCGKSGATGGHTGTHSCTEGACNPCTLWKPNKKIKEERNTRHIVVNCFPSIGRKELSSGCFSPLFYLQVAINGANLQNVFMLLTLEPLLARSPFLVLHVRRSNLVGDALRELSIHSDIDLKKPLKVSFPHTFSTLSSS